MLRARVAPALFPPEQSAAVKRLACERPAQRGQPLSRFSVGDVAAQARNAGIGMSYSTVWRRLDEDAIRPWFHRYWLFSHDPHFLAKAGPVLDLYQGRWQGKRLGAGDRVLCADELTGLQALWRLHEGAPPAPGHEARLEFEYERQGTLCYLAFQDVLTGQVYGETAPANGIEPFEGALGRLLALPNYRAADRVFVVVDGGCAHHAKTSPARVQARHPQVTMVHLPTHASWLNQIELYFSILKRKALHPADFASRADLEQRIKWFQWVYNSTAAPFCWKFTRADLREHVRRLVDRGWLPPQKRVVAAKPLTN